MSTIIVREATVTEVDKVQRLNHLLFEHDHQFFKDLHLDWPLTKEGKEYFTSTVTDKDKSCFVAESNGEVIGYLAGAVKKPSSIYQGKWAELENMIVTPGSRRTGVGTKLIDAFKLWCLDQKCDRIIVNAYAGNTKALSFYHKNGFDDYSINLIHQL